MIKGSIVGGAGYTGGELLRWSLAHPELEITHIRSNSQHGKSVTEIHRDLIGDSELHFSADHSDEVEVYFLCMGHGKSRSYVEEHLSSTDKIIIDLSHDFRLNGDHTFQYGLPEIYRTKIQQNRHIANPGCFATAIQLALLPLAKDKLLSETIHVHAITGSTGAGQSLSPTTHFSWRNNNVSVYKAFNHQHLNEINQTLSDTMAQEIPPIYFVPIRGDFTRGIFASLYTTIDQSLEQCLALYQNHYATHPFVHVTTSPIDLKQVVHTNKCILQLQKHGDQLHIISIIDNLVKGAVGQALQNFNLITGLPEALGLQSKSISF